MSRPLRILQVVNVRWFNATAWYAFFLSRLLRSAGHEVLIAGLEGTASYKKAIEWDLPVSPLNLNTVQPHLFLREAIRARKLINEFKPDIVNCHRGEGFFLWKLIQPADCPYALVRTRGDQRAPKSNLINRLLHQKGADLLISTNSVTTLEFTRHLKCPEEHIATILGGVDTEIFRYDANGRQRIRNEFGIAPEELVLGLVGRFDEVKGYQEVLSALAALCHNDGPLSRRQGSIPFRALFLGFPSRISAQTMRGWISEYQLEDKVIVTGFRKDHVACMSAMDLAIVASQGSEAIARAALELMSCGVPLLGTRVGVMPDLLPHWALVPPGDPDALQHIIEKAFVDRKWRAQLREEGLKRIASLAEHDFLAETLKAYETALANRDVRLSRKSGTKT